MNESGKVYAKRHTAETDFVNCYRSCLIAVALCWYAATAVANPFPAEIDLSSLFEANGGDGSKGFVVPSDGATSVGDFNNDGIDDLSIACYFIYGKSAPFPAEFDLSAVGGDGTEGFIVTGDDSDDNVCFSVGSADINDDQLTDLIVGVPGALFGLGRTYVVFGQSAGFPAEVALASLLPDNGGDGSAGFVVQGRGIPGLNIDALGSAVSGLADVNGDNVDDALLGAPGFVDDGHITFFIGEAYIIYGSTDSFSAMFDLSELSGNNAGRGVILKGEEFAHGTGDSVGETGDINGDGINDFFVSDLNAFTETYVVFGDPLGFPEEIELTGLLAANGGNGSLGFVVLDAVRARPAGDLNGDGLGDLAIAVPYAFPTEPGNIGRVVILFGRDQGFPAEIDLTELLEVNGGDGSMGIVINGIGDPSFLGDVAGAGDINGDGLDDIVLGARHAQENIGESYVVFGRSDGFAPEFELSSLLSSQGGDGSAGFVMGSDLSFDGVGANVGPAGDINDDGIDDFVVGARDRIYVIYGRRDSDNDNIDDSVDNCTLISNPAQIDTDGDGFGNVCDADIGGAAGPGFDDCFVNFADLNFLSEAFFSAPGNATWNPNADFTGLDETPDLRVNFADLLRMKELFFAPPGPSATDCVPN